MRVSDTLYGQNFDFITSCALNSTDYSSIMSRLIEEDLSLNEEDLKRINTVVACIQSKKLGQADQQMKRVLKYFDTNGYELVQADNGLGFSIKKLHGFEPL